MGGPKQWKGLQYLVSTQIPVITYTCCHGLESNTADWTLGEQTDCVYNWRTDTMNNVWIQHPLSAEGNEMKAPPFQEKIHRLQDAELFSQQSEYIICYNES